MPRPAVVGAEEALDGSKAVSTLERQRWARLIRRRFFLSSASSGTAGDGSSSSGRANCGWAGVVVGAQGSELQKRMRASRTSTAASEWCSCWRRRRGSWEQVPGKRSWPIVSQNRTSWKTQGRGLRSHVSRAPKRRQKLAWERSPHGFLAPGNRREPGGDLGFQSNL